VSEVRKRPAKVEPLGEAIHIWIETNPRDVVLFFECTGGGPRDGQTFGVPIDKPQAASIHRVISEWLKQGEREVK